MDVIASTGIFMGHVFLQCGVQESQSVTQWYYAANMGF